MSATQNKALVADYFAKLQAGDPAVADLLDDDVVWWVPPGSDMAGEHRGRDAVLEFMGRGVAYYSAEHPLEVLVEQTVAEGDWVAVQFVVEAVTAGGRDYRNHYHFAFEIRDGRIVRVKEYLDTKYAHDAFSAGGS